MMAEGGLEGMDAGKGEGGQGREQSLWRGGRRMRMIQWLVGRKVKDENVGR